MTETTERAHALWNPSSAHIWRDCGLYVDFKKKAEAEGRRYDEPGAAAERGTLLHKIAEHALKDQLSTEHSIDESIQKAWAHAGGGPLTDDDLEQVHIAVEAVLDLLTAHPNMNVTTEVRVPLSHEPGSKGTLDVAAWNDDLVMVVDHKFGRMEVEPDDPQLQLYGANLLDRLQALDPSKDLPEAVLLGIVQPALHRDVSVVVTTAQRLRAFQAETEAIVEAQEQGEFGGASELTTCQWCPFKKECTHRVKLAGQVMDDLPEKGSDAAAWPAELVERIVRNRKGIQSVIDDCVELVRGDPESYPDWKRVSVANQRKWTELMDEGEIAHELNLAGITDRYQLRPPGQLIKAYPHAAQTISDLSTDQGFHIRLSPLAPGKGSREVPVESGREVDPQDLFGLDAEETSSPDRKAPAKAAARKKAGKKAATKKAGKQAGKKAAGKKAPKKKAASKKGTK